MKRRATRIWVWLAMVAGGATLFQTSGFTTQDGAINGGCSQFWANGIVSSVDTCYLLDCENGFFGGLIDPCDPNNPILTDCPGIVIVDEDEEETDTTTTSTLFGF